MIPSVYIQIRPDKTRFVGLIWSQNVCKSCQLCRLLASQELEQLITAKKKYATISIIDVLLITFAVLFAWVKNKTSKTPSILRKPLTVWPLISSYIQSTIFYILSFKNAGYYIKRYVTHGTETIFLTRF